MVSRPVAHEQPPIFLFPRQDPPLPFQETLTTFGTLRSIPATHDPEVSFFWLQKFYVFPAGFFPGSGAPACALHIFALRHFGNVSFPIQAMFFPPEAVLSHRELPRYFLSSRLLFSPQNPSLPPEA